MFIQRPPNGSPALQRVVYQENAAMLTSRQVAPSSGQPASHPRFGQGFMSILQNAMAFLDRNIIADLAVSDVGAMVAPRTLIEFFKRGLDPARETLIREVGGTLTNTFLAGWLGYAVTKASLKTFPFNPKGMDHTAHIDATTLEMFGKITREVTNSGKVQSAEDLPKEFLRTLLSRLKSTDNVYNVYPQHFVGRQKQGMMELEHVEEIVNRYFNSTGHRAYNLEEVVAKQSAEVNLTGQALQQYQQNLRLNLAHSIRKTEKPFLQKVYNLVTGNTMKMTDAVFVLDSKSQVMHKLDTMDVLKKSKYYLEEHLNRALADPATGKISSEAVNTKVLFQRLFSEGRAGQSWLQRKVLPNMADGLVSYAYKTKWFTTLAPFTMALLTGMTTVVINNMITRKKHGGKEFFPGETAFMKNGMSQTAAASAASTMGGTPV